MRNSRKSVSQCFQDRTESKNQFSNISRILENVAELNFKGFQRVRLRTPHSRQIWENSKFLSSNEKIEKVLKNCPLQIDISIFLQLVIHIELASAEVRGGLEGAGRSAAPRNPHRLDAQRHRLGGYQRQVTESGRRLSEVGNWKAAQLGEYGSSEELVHVWNRGCIAAVSPGIVAVITRWAECCLQTAKIRD